jgi:UDP-glucose 4-epimerase
MFKDKVLMITGGTGSFGNSVLERFLLTEVKEIRIFSRDEKKQEDMRMHYLNDKLKFYLGDVRDYQSVADSMKGVDFVFHAAALKQVPSCEFYPIEAMKTNALGAENVMNAASLSGVKKVVLLSTDKAVYPVNAMGVTKALMEKFMVAKSRIQQKGETVFCATRYGNVMASRGSVIPLFISQLLNGQPITITDSSMTRFMMSLEESVDLVLYAFLNGDQGDIFVQKAPSCTIGELAESLKDIFLKDNSISIIGTRHGEKLYESLISREEMLRAQDEGGFYRIPSDNRDLNYNKYSNQGDEKLSNLEDYTSHNTKRLERKELKELLLSIPYVQELLNK